MDYHYRELDIPQIPASEETRPNLKAFKERVMGKEVWVEMVDGREFVGRLQCVDHLGNIFL